MKKLIYNILRCQHRAALGAASECFGLVGSSALAFHVHHPAEAQIHIHRFTAAVAVERSLAEDTDAVVPFKLLAALVAMYLACHSHSLYSSKVFTSQLPRVKEENSSFSIGWK